MTSAERCISLSLDTEKPMENPFTITYKEQYFATMYMAYPNEATPVTQKIDYKVSAVEYEGLISDLTSDFNVNVVCPDNLLQTPTSTNSYTLTYDIP